VYYYSMENLGLTAFDLSILIFVFAFLVLSLAVIVYCILELSSYIYTWFSFQAPYVPNGYEFVTEALNLAEVGSADVVADLGSGDGRVLLVALKDFKVSKALGVEKDFFQSVKSRMRLWWAVFRNHILPNSYVMRRGDFFDLDFSEATVVYLYLYPRALDQISVPLIARLKPGTRVVSCRYRFPDSSDALGLSFEKTVSLKDYSIFLYSVRSV
jgi:hypothetical protein